MPGTVVALETEGEISLVEVDVDGRRLSSLVLESSESAAYIAVGSPVTVLFKESEVSLSLADCPSLSIRNRLPGIIMSIAEGRILTHVILDCGVRTLHSLITTHALRELGLRPGLAVQALIKSTEVSLAEGHASL